MWPAADECGWPRCPRATSRWSGNTETGAASAGPRPCRSAGPHRRTGGLGAPTAVPPPGSARIEPSPPPALTVSVIRSIPGAGRNPSAGRIPGRAAPSAAGRASATAPREAQGAPEGRCRPRGASPRWPNWDRFSAFGTLASVWMTRVSVEKPVNGRRRLTGARVWGRWMQDIPVSVHGKATASNRLIRTPVSTCRRMPRSISSRTWGLARTRLTRS